MARNDWNDYRDAKPDYKEYTECDECGRSVYLLDGDYVQDEYSQYFHPKCYIKCCRDNNELPDASLLPVGWIEDQEINRAERKRESIKDTLAEDKARKK